MLIGEPKEVYVYADGKRTNELEAIGYPVISTRQWEKFVVKVKETVPSVEFNGKPTPVIFNNLMRNSGRILEAMKSKSVP